ncbi:MAG: hypothetical protein C4567_18710 [Deltaproteobacteria bacterium]|nr:MAG: hypothetical protein C4567_18710 [Deltaproteobacteria bacterium]
MTTLSGKKTYIFSGLMIAKGLIILGLAICTDGWGSQSAMAAMMGLFEILFGGTAAALRAGVTKSGPTGPGSFPGLDAGGPGVTGS